jgi:hypothetical protein
MPSLIEIALSAPSDVGRSRMASAGEAGEPAALGLAPGWALDPDGLGTPVVEVAELPSLGEVDVVQAARIKAITIKDVDLTFTVSPPGQPLSFADIDGLVVQG